MPGTDRPEFERREGEDGGTDPRAAIDKAHRAVRLLLQDLLAISAVQWSSLADPAAASRRSTQHQVAGLLRTLSGRLTAAEEVIGPTKLAFAAVRNEIPEALEGLRAPSVHELVVKVARRIDMRWRADFRLRSFVEALADEVQARRDAGPVEEQEGRAPDEFFVADVLLDPSEAARLGPEGTAAALLDSLFESSSPEVLRALDSELEGEYARATRGLAREEPPREASVDVWVTSKDLAAEFGVNHESLRKRLERRRLTDFDCFMEVQDRSPNQARFLYRRADVAHIAQSLRGRPRSSGQRPPDEKSKG